MSTATETRICRPCGQPATGKRVRCVMGDPDSGWVAVDHPDCYAAHLDSLEPEYLTTVEPA